eukprot:m.415 g.415  ORF g.415 m.415 type:complete len:64 (-) comp586_c0_seq1:657-848(-)
MYDHEPFEDHGLGLDYVDQGEYTAPLSTDELNDLASMRQSTDDSNFSVYLRNVELKIAFICGQ